MKDQFVIELRKGNRFFFICEFEGTQHMTWDKKFAIKFNSIIEAQEYIDENELERNVLSQTGLFKNYQIKKTSEVSSH